MTFVLLSAFCVPVSVAASAKEDSGYPASASDANPYAPMITYVNASGQPVTHGNTFGLVVYAHLPEGADGEMSVEWYHGDTLVASGAMPTGAISIEITATPDMPLETWFRAVVINTYIDESGQEQTACAAQDLQVLVSERNAPMFWGNHHNTAIIGKRFNTSVSFLEVSGKLSVEWYLDGKLVATGQTLNIPVTEDMYPNALFSVVATNTYVDENGQTQAARSMYYVSERVDYPAPWYTTLFYWAIAPFALLLPFMFFGPGLLWNFLFGWMS